MALAPVGGKDLRTQNPHLWGCLEYPGRSKEMFEFRALSCPFSSFQPEDAPLNTAHLAVHLEAQ